MIFHDEEVLSGGGIEVMVDPGGNDVLAISRGKVAVAKEIAASLKSPLDLIISRGKCTPKNPEFTIGAVRQKRKAILDENNVRQLGVSRVYIDADGHPIFQR